MLLVVISDLPHVLATMNILTIASLIGGYLAVRDGREHEHEIYMKTALLLGCLFLAVYAYYKLNSGFAKFGGVGMIRPIYFSILFTHVMMAAISLLLVPLAVMRALRRQYAQHKKIVRWALPIWLFVAISGVVVYIMTVHIYPTPIHL
ncbi:MAG: DUF420 domain-containing protein [bacterium]|nr:DUF420 domain-containing protein [bacterium]